MINFPTCKINLGLHVLSKREDGFHDLETCMLEVPYTDVIEVCESEKDQFYSSGLSIPGTGNLCLEALQLIRKHYNIPPVSIELLKNIPMGGGLGGGSSDAAFTLKAINQYFRLGIPNQKLEEFAAELGSDCSFFVQGGLQLCTGRGEILTPIPFTLPSMTVVLVNIGIHVPTSFAFKAMIPISKRKSILDILQQPKETWKDELVNDFETTVFLQHPELKQLKESFYENGAFYAAMSGSGSTVFGCFDHHPASIKWNEKPQFEQTLLID